MAVYWPVHRGVIEPPCSDNAAQCSSALLLPAESPDIEQEVELDCGGDTEHCHVECAKHLVVADS